MANTLRIVEPEVMEVEEDIQDQDIQPQIQPQAQEESYHSVISHPSQHDKRGGDKCPPNIKGPVLGDKIRRKFSRKVKILPKKIGKKLQTTHPS